MGNVLRPVKKCKKSRRLGEVEVIQREEYAAFELDAKVEAIRALIPLGLLVVLDGGKGLRSAVKKAMQKPCAY